MKRESGRVVLSEPLVCRAAAKEDLPDILRIVEEAREGLKKQRVDQWQGPYPDEKHFLFDIDRGECFVILHGAETAAFFTLSTRAEASYAAISDGRWTEGMDAAVLHRCAVAAKYRGSGMAEKLMRFVDERALALGLRCVRTDTHRKNKAMQRLLRESGYRYRGNLQVFVEPGHDTARQAYEKIIKIRK